jgi:hypothetical protein
MHFKYALALTLCFILFAGINNYAVQMPADTLTQPDTTSVRTDTTEQKDNSLSENISGDFANRLKSQLNLTEEQTDQVKAIIAGYIDSHSSDNSDTGSASEQILKVLNEIQRSSWQSIQDSFWSDLKRRIQDDID